MRKISLGIVAGLLIGTTCTGLIAQIAPKNQRRATIQTTGRLIPPVAEQAPIVQPRNQRVARPPAPVTSRSYVPPPQPERRMSFRDKLRLLGDALMAAGGNQPPRRNDGGMIHGGPLSGTIMPGSGGGMIIGGPLDGSIMPGARGGMVVGGPLSGTIMPDANGGMIHGGPLSGTIMPGAGGGMIIGGPLDGTIVPGR
jgi:hypothetical protein